MRSPPLSPVVLSFLLFSTFPLGADDIASASDEKLFAIRDGLKILTPSSKPVSGSVSIGALSPGEFANIRSEINRKSHTDAWRLVHRTLPHTDRGREYCVKAWFEGKVIQKLTLIDSKGADDTAILAFFWRDGRLTSVFKFFTGCYTGNPQSKPCSETYNFQDDRLSSWISEPGGQRDPSRQTFQETGSIIQKEATELSRPIFRDVGIR
jgi:hypothetical protein